MKKTVFYFVVLLMIFIYGSLDAQAATLGNVSIHGFGGWVYGRTDNENRFLYGNEDGNYDEMNFSLNISASPYERLSLYIQPGFQESNIEDNVELDYAFAQWYVSDALIFRVGKVKAPFMTYTEIYDVGTLRPFFTLPQGVYKQLAAKAYKGLGITGSFSVGGDWDILYDVYGGKLELEPNLGVSAEQMIFEFIEPVARDMFGGRLMIQPPLDGLSFGISSYTADVEFEYTDRDEQYTPLNDTYLLFGVSIEYLSDRLWIHSEYLGQHESPRVEADVAYIEAGYHVTEQWQVAARYEIMEFDTDEPGFLDYPESFREHEEIAMGLNYWFNPNLVLKFSYHIIEGNRFATPEEIEDFLAGYLQGKFEETTHLFSFGAQFSF